LFEHRAIAGQIGVQLDLQHFGPPLAQRCGGTCGRMHLELVARVTNLIIMGRA
jgi:hypothetical protein